MSICSLDSLVLYFFLLKYIICDKLHEKKSNYGIITSVIIKLCKKAVEKRK